jgi:hypothetical protein
MRAVRQYLGRAAFSLGVGGWLMQLGALWAGGIDPTPEQYNTLRAMIGLSLLAECFAVPIGFVAFVIGPHRLAAFAGLMFAAAFFLYFTGMMLMFFAARG